jgi:hypothetical protein
MSGNGRMQARDILASEDAVTEAARLLRRSLNRLKDEPHTTAEEVALAHALAAYVEARKLTP